MALGRIITPRAQRLRRSLAGLLALALALVATGPVAAWSPDEFFSRCENDCAFSLFAGDYIEDSLNDMLLMRPPPTGWDFTDEDQFVGLAFSRRTRLYARHFTFEPEFGVGQRYGRQDVTEVWGALFLRYQGLPWDAYLPTTFAVSTGLNWASEISETERERARDGKGDNLMHYLAPEVTFALPDAPDSQLFFRIHHRSGVFGLVNDAHGGAHYGTIGLRIWF
ncbi:hypothetical protein [Amaricoccus sp. W119]|uniref:hypothetical protein n=1 Tax=Amaricoccus sp. W119 TaxID=3391833 RepID=UPI0039A4A12D